jgi:hypothetical protein
MGGPVERAYLVSVCDLREIAGSLMEGKREYKLTYDLEKKIRAVVYNDDGLTALCLTFLILTL